METLATGTIVTGLCEYRMVPLWAVFVLRPGTSVLQVSQIATTIMILRGKGDYRIGWSEIGVAEIVRHSPNLALIKALSP